MAKTKFDIDHVSGLVIWSAAESAVTIMAALIPVLRTLFHDLRASDRAYYASQRIDDSGSSTFARNRDRKVNVLAAMADLEGQRSYLDNGFLIQKWYQSNDYEASRPCVWYGRVFQHWDKGVSVYACC
jgi:hypothetical protein